MSSPNNQVAAAILNGGKARRMQGVDKARLAVGGRRIADTQLALLQTRCAPIAMVVADGSQTEGLAVEAIQDRVGGQGPLDGIAAALAWSPTPWVLVLACDMPDVHPGLLDMLLNARDTRHDIVAMAPGGRVQPLLALYHQRLLPVLDARLAAGELRATSLLQEPPAGVRVRFLDESEIRRIDPETKSFRNLNCLEDLSQS
jgi:molybdopterin-guanine dinucleotide biosynthesis protein A